MYKNSRFIQAEASLHYSGAFFMAHGVILPTLIFSPKLKPVSQRCTRYTMTTDTATTPLLFMPDISGFTRFVNETEVKHSEHIISELLEILIAENQLGLSLAEVEGDALLYYTSAQVPDLRQLAAQCKRMFRAFHQHLKLYETQRICECGACRSAIDLTLKFIAHKGDFGYLRVYNQQKPHGREVVLIHRLLKNNIDSREYLLLNGPWDHLQTDLKALAASGLHFAQGSTTYDNFEEQHYHYAQISHWRELVQTPPRASLPQPTENPIVTSNHYPVSIERAYAVLIDLNIRKEWNPAAAEIKTQDPKRINRIGDEHICVFENGQSVKLESVAQRLSDGRLLYGEVARKFQIFKEFTSYFILEKEAEGVKLTIEVHLRGRPLWGWIFMPLARKKIVRNLQKIHANLEQYFLTSTPHMQAQDSSVQSA